MNFADWKPAVPLAIQRANELAAEQHAAQIEALQTRAQAEREKSAGRASDDAAFEEYLTENRRRKAEPWAGQPDDALTPTATIDKMRAQAHVNREASRDNKFADQDAALAAINEQHQANARASQDLNQRAWEERLEQLSDVAAEREKQAESTATIDEMRRQRKDNGI